MASFALTEEQELLRKTARQFLEDKADTDVVRELMQTEAGFREGLWSEIAQMGWQGMAIPEDYGGAGYGWVEVSVLMEEMGRALFCAPFLSSAVLGASALLLGGTEAQKESLLPGVASGERRLAVAYLEPSGDHGPGGIELTAERDDDGWVLDGTKDYVVDGHTAHHLVVAARTGEDVRDVTLLLVPGEADGVAREDFTPLDLTRKQATVSFDGVRVDGDAVVGEVDGGWSLLQEVVRRGAAMVANEQVGGSQRMLEMSVEYGKTRKQFGRAIGSFQAVKHRCADMLVGVESAKSAAYHAARVLAAGDDEEAAIAVPLAAAHCSEVFEQVAGDNIQNHGGIGFTWEHDAHLWFKRAKSSKLLFGGPKRWRRCLADTLEL